MSMANPAEAGAQKAEKKVQNGEKPLEIHVCPHVPHDEVIRSTGRPPTRIPDAHRTSWADFRSDVRTCGLVAVFTLVAPVFAFGWMALPWGRMATFWTAYLISQNMPVCFTKRFFKWRWGGGIFTDLNSYFKPVRVTKAAMLDPSKSYIMGWHPHGRLFMGIGCLLSNLYDKGWLAEMDVGDQHVHLGINDTMFRIPFISYWFTLLGLIPVNKHCIKKTLGEGNSVVIVIGGIEEVLLGTYDDRDVLYLNKRLGFAKIAMDKGAGLVPIYCFGENQLFTHSTHEVLGFWRFINRFVKLGAPFPISGRWGLPFPFRRPLLVAFGAPLFAEKGETLVQFHARYIEALHTLYRNNIGHTADPQRKLVIA